jgi:TonB family protein
MRVLLVDHDSEALESITRAIRGVLELDCVTSKGDALLLLRQNQYDVLIACERAVDGSGLDLLGRTTRTAVPLKRIFAAAPERLQLLGPRLAPFKVQRTINYPIDLEELWLAIAQVTSGPNDETDGTIERVVLDERGIPSTGTMPRAPIPPRPPAPLAATPPPVAPAAGAATSTSASGRYATARLPQPAPEPPLRAPPPPRVAPPAARTPAPPRTTSDTGRMRAPVVPPATTSDTGRMRAPAMPPMTATAPPPEPRELPDWTPEAPSADDFAEIAAQARFGVQQKVVDEAAKRRRQRVFAACGIAVVVAGAIVFLIEKFYDPAARAREQAIAAEVKRMSDQQKVTDDLTLIEIDIENAIMNNDLDMARRELATLIEKSPNHPRREFLEKSIDRAAELARLSPQGTEGGGDKGTQSPVQAAVLPSNDRPRARTTEKPPARPVDRPVSRAPDRLATSRTREAPPGGASSRSYGAPINDTPREAVIPLDAPINAPPTYTARRSDNSFAGRTIEASDSGASGSPARAPAPQPPVYQPPVTNAAVPAPQTSAGSAVAPTPSAAPSAAPQPPAPTDVVPAKIVKRVMPVAPSGVSRKTTGFVVLSYNIQTNGKVSDVQVVESQPAGVFDESARDAVRRWVYEPRKENGVAVASPGKARLVFDGSVAN